ncbi:MAG TPA: DUF4097 family beta strand repeat-containing protein [Acidimicrobiales bacterium]|nr:DUF4097 family beta strand repeat-containing protein [Acidimicrobiales bacterium]
MSQHRFETPGRLEVRVDNKAGPVRLRTHQGNSTEVDLNMDGLDDPDALALVRVEHDERDGTHRVVVEVPNEVASNSSGVQIYGRRKLRVVVPRLGDLIPAFFGGKKLAVTLRVPELAAVDVSALDGEVSVDGRVGPTMIETSSGDVSVGSVEGNLEIRTDSGEVAISSVSGEAKVTTLSGDVSCGRLSGTNRVKTATGDVFIDVSSGPIAAQTASGDVNIGRLEAGCQIQTASGDQQVDQLVAGVARMETVSGDLTIGIARSTVVAVDAESVTGELQSEIELGSEEPFDQSGNDSGPRAELRARTVSGDLLIRRARL